jgi:signal peptidase I
VRSAEPPQRSRFGGAVHRWVRDLVVAVGFSAFIIVFLYQPVKVEGTSMLPGLADQERIFVNKFVYRWVPIQRGDVIVFRYPRDPSKSYIKRVIAVEGERVSIDAGKVYVNGQALEESYVPRGFEDERSLAELTVPRGAYFVLGDHRNLSSDSRDFGVVHEEFVLGKAVFGYWPVERMGAVR